MSDQRRRSGQETLDLLEEAFHLLRMAPAAAFGWYAAGVVPFILSLLYFWTDMSWSADARQDCAVNATGMAFAFVWLKFCQGEFAQYLRAQINLEFHLRMNLRRALRMFVQQAILQPSRLFILPVALIATIPFGWLLAFYENVTAFGEARNLRTLWSKSWRQARLWPRQNHLAIGIFILLFVVMSVNVLLIMVSVPLLIRTFSGFESVFTRSGQHALNSTSLAVVALLAYFCCDPLLKAIYLLRCFHGESLESGEDLRVELRRVKQATATFLSVVLLIAGTCSSFGVDPSRSPVAAVEVSELDRSIVETIARPEFRWRAPREQTDKEDKSQKENAFDRWLRRLFKTVGKWWDAFWKWLSKLMPQPAGPAGDGDGVARLWSRSILELMLILLCGGLLLLLGLKAREYLQRTRSSSRTSVRAKLVDLAQEGVTADQLPEDEWLRLAGELIGRGDWRLGMRALFLAGLAHLARRELIALARHKSNRDYQGELRRRAPAQGDLQDAFARNLLEVERAWYGYHEVNAEVLADFESNLEKIRAT